ncbi:MAG: L,D-transpeptidase family protein [Panacagrimonas sp.]
MLLSFRRLATVLSLAISASVQAGPIAPLKYPEPEVLPERSLLSAMDRIRDGELRGAITDLEDLLREKPNFRAAQLIYADLLAARSGHGLGLFDRRHPEVEALLEETRSRLNAEQFAPKPGTVPSAVLELASEYPYLVLVDLSGNRLHLMRNVDGQLRHIGSRYAGIGRAGFGKQIEGDLRTPVGVYHITGWKADESLPELYGAGALPLDYPNLWDRHLQKTGYGIWVHGVPRDTFARPPRSSEGCVTLANDDLLWLRPFVYRSQTPVVLSADLEWIPRQTARQRRDQFLQRFDAWRQHWIDLDTEGYLRIYADEFQIPGMDRQAFAEYRREVDRGKTFVEMKVRDLSLFNYPGEDMLVAKFTLDYRTDHYQTSSRREQYWRRDAQGDWKIIREEDR